MPPFGPPAFSSKSPFISKMGFGFSEVVSPHGGTLSNVGDRQIRAETTIMSIFRILSLVSGGTNVRRREDGFPGYRLPGPVQLGRYRPKRSFGHIA